MRILLGDKLLEFTDEELDYMYVDEGNESEVFRYGETALKIYKKFCPKERLDLDTVVELSKIPTKRILMPEDIIRDADTLEFIGYSMPFIYKFPRDILMRIKMNEFLDELDVIHSDLELLAVHHVDVEDIHIDNVLYNQGFFIGDPGSFEVRRKDSVGTIYRNNVYTFNRFVKNDIFPLSKVSKAKREELDAMFDDYFFIGDQMRYSIPPKETVRQYIKRMTK